MKQRFLLVASLLLLGYHESNAQRFRAGFSGGLTVTDIDGADTKDNDNDFYKLGFTAGALVNAQIGKKSSLQFEINYIQKGSLQIPDSLNNGYFKIAIDYVEVPLLVKRHVYFNMKKGPVNKVDMGIGVSVGQMVRKVVIDKTNNTLPNTDNLYNKTDVSLLAEIDYNFTKNICFCFRYSNSLIPAIKKNIPYAHFLYYTFNRGNNMVFQFSFKFLFGAKKQETTPTPVPTEAPVD